MADNDLVPLPADSTVGGQAAAALTSTMGEIAKQLAFVGDNREELTMLAGHYLENGIEPIIEFVSKHVRIDIDGEHYPVQSLSFGMTELGPVFILKVPDGQGEVE